MKFNPSEIFPKSSTENFIETSPPSEDYNCIAWAYGDDTKWYWPDSENFAYWPSDISREPTLETFIKLFENAGYNVCDSYKFETGYQKIAIFVNVSNNVPTHAARQLKNNWWTSKIGDWEDIMHTLDSIHGNYYGTVAVVMKKASNQAFTKD